MSTDGKSNPDKKSPPTQDRIRDHLAVQLGTDKDLSKSRFPKTKVNEVYSKPKTISGRIAFLLDQDDQSSNKEKTNEMYPIKRRKPKTLTGKVAFVCGTEKNTIRSTLQFIFIFATALAVAFYIKSKKSDSVDYWGENQSSDPVKSLYKQYKGKAVEAYKAMPEDRKKALRKTIEGNEHYRNKAREVYNSLSEEKKKEVRKYIDNK